MNYIQTNKK